MFVKRTFYPIGQGAFYGEYFKNQEKEFNIVYDCGSVNESELEREINCYKHNKIDILFLSHFHDDHINGVIKLINKCEVKSYYYYHYCHNLYNKSCGCLYMGDITLNQKVATLIDNYLSIYYKNISTIQVPHHGSRTSNYDDFWQKFDRRSAIISYGIKNRYKHPNPNTLKTLFNNKLFLVPVHQYNCPFIQIYNLIK